MELMSGVGELRPRRPYVRCLSLAGEHCELLTKNQTVTGGCIDRCMDKVMDVLSGHVAFCRQTANAHCSFIVRMTRTKIMQVFGRQTHVYVRSAAWCMSSTHH